MRKVLFVACAVGLALAGSGCSGAECGPGTALEEGACVPDGLARCGAGTALAGGECKPVCAAGTEASPAGCVLARGSCGTGTELRDGACHLITPFQDGVEFEAPEPNDTLDGAKRFDLPSIGAEPKSLGGVVGLPAGTTPDFDAFVFTAKALERVRIEAVAVGAPSVGVVLQPARDPSILNRFVVSLTSRDAARDLVLPVGGDWIVKVSEANNFDAAGGRPRGSESFSYVVKVGLLPAPALRQLDEAGKATGSYTAGDVYEIPGDGASTVMLELKLTAEGGPFPGLRSVWAVDGEGNLVLDAADRLATGGDVTPMEAPRLVVPPTGVKLGIDYSVALGPSTGYALETKPVQITEVLPPFPYQRDASLAGDGFDVYAVDVEPNTIVTVEVDDIGDDADLKVELRDAQFRLLSSDTGYFSADVKGFVPANGAGRWYVVVLDTDVDATDSDLGYSLGIAGLEVRALAAVGVPGTVTETLTVTAGSETWLAISATADAAAKLVATPDAGVEVDLRTFSSSLASGFTVYGNTPGQPAVIERIQLGQSSAVLLRIDSDQAGTVELEIETRTLTYTREVEPNDSVATAQPIAAEIGASAEVAAALSHRDDKDFFQFEIVGSEAVDVRIETFNGLTGGSPDTEVVLRDANGRLLDEDDDGGAGLFSLLEAAALEPGTYYVECRYAGAARAQNDYLLSITLQ